MKLNGKMPWWLVILTGALILGAGVFLLAANTPDANKNVALKTLLFLVGFAVFIYGVFYLYKAFKFKNDHRLFVMHLIHGILDIVLLLLMLFIRDSQTLLGVILASWFIVFGLFGLVESGAGSEKNIQSRRISALLLIIGLALLIIPLVLQINDYYIILLGIAGIIIGGVRIVQGIVQKSRYEDRTSGGRSNLY